MAEQRVALIIGAGPAGLTTAYELLTRTDIKPIIIEKTNRIGGISTTVDYKGNKIDIGGHRFFSKSDRVMNWWSNILPQENSEISAHDNDNVMMVRHRLSRIYYLRTFFDYPLHLHVTLIRALGIRRTMRIGLSYIYSALFPLKEEKTLEQFFINRFGRELYKTFFKSYTEKVWGVPPSQISTEWGAQRIKTLNIGRALLDFFKKFAQSNDDVSQKNIETSLINRFLYPKFGPGHMWEVVAKQVKQMGGQIIMNQTVSSLFHAEHNMTGIALTDNQSHETRNLRGEFVFSTMPVKDLINAFTPDAPHRVIEIANNLPYRDFITVGLLVKKLKQYDVASDGTKRLIKDNWIYIQEEDVMVGRLQIFNNWSPYMVKDQDTVWVGLEYFCQDTDPLWKKSESELKDFAIDELVKIHFVDRNDVLDGTVIKMEKTYPSYFGSYKYFSEIREYTDTFENLFLIGRNGMHRYNNQDHSMLAAMTAVDNIIAGKIDKKNIWETNTEKEYHEEKCNQKKDPAEQQMHS